MAKDPRILAHLRAITDFFDADDSEGAYEYVKGLPKEEAALVVEGLRMTADAIVVAVFPDSTEARLIGSTYLLERKI